MGPLISFIVCSYNAPELILRCINSILKQKYNGKKEIIIVDGGSDKKTLNVINEIKEKHKEVILLNNKNKLPEGYGMGKWLGWKIARGRYVFIIDQDNELQGDDCVKEMIIPLEDEKVFGCVCKIKIDHDDSLTNQYVSLAGTDPFFAYRSLGGFISLKKIAEDKRRYFLIKMNPKNIFITGGNCFVYRKKILDEVGGYIQDTQNVVNLVKRGYTQVAVTKNIMTHHLATKGFFDFIRKKKKWAESYKWIKRERTFSYIPSTKIQRKEMIINFFLIITIIPNVFISIKKIIETKEKAWILHSILALVTTVIYGYYFLSSKFKI